MECLLGHYRGPRLLVPAGVDCFTVFPMHPTSPGSLTICQIITLLREPKDSVKTVKKVFLDEEADV